MKKTATLVMVIMMAAALAAAEESTVVVTATRNAMDASRIPGNVTVITGEDIADAGYNNVVEALSDAGGLYFRSTSGNAAQVEIGLRGFGENSDGRVLVIMDGRKLNRPDMARTDWMQISLGNIERIEVSRGANSAMYGDHAVAGVVNIITKQGSEEQKASLSAQIGSHSSDAETATISGTKGSLSYNAVFNHNETDGYRDRSAYAAWGISGLVAYDLGDSANVSLSLGYDDLSYELPGYLFKSEMDADPQQSTFLDDSARNEYMDANLGLTMSFGKYGNLDANVLFARKDIVSDIASWGSFADMRVDTYAVLPKYTVDCEIKGHANRLVAGIDYYMEDLTVERFSDKPRTMPSAAADLEKNSLGFYARDDFDICESLIFGLAARTEQTDVSGIMTGIFDDEKEHSESVFDISLVYRFGEDMDSKVFAKYGTVYRYPYLDEQMLYIGYGTDQIYTDIEAETGDNLEIGTALAVRDNLNVAVTAYLLNMEDEIAYNSATWRNENLDETRHVGAEAAIKYDVTDEASVEINYAYSEATFRKGDNMGKDIPLAPTHVASISGSLALPHDLTLGLGVRYVDAVYLGGDYANEAEKLSSYVVADVNLRYKPESVEGLEAFIAVDNLFGEKYASLGYYNIFTGDIGYYPDPELTVRGGVSYDF